MVYHCLTDLRTNTARNIHRICEELELEVASVTPAAVKAAYQTLPLLPDDEWKLEVLEPALLEWRDLEAVGQASAFAAHMIDLPVAVWVSSASSFWCSDAFLVHLRYAFVGPRLTGASCFESFVRFLPNSRCDRKSASEGEPSNEIP